MFGRKEKQALAGLPPLHQQLVNDRELAVAMSPPEWAALAASLRTNDAVLTRAKHKLPPRANGVVMPLVRVLGQDAGPAGNIGVRLDLRGHEAPGKSYPPTPIPPPRPNVVKAEQVMSVDPWLAVNAVLRDGTTIDLWITDVVTTRNLRKRSSSGRIKAKSKAKVAQRVRARVVLPKGAGVRVPPTPSPGWCQVAAKTSGSRAQITAKARYAIAYPDPAWQLRQVLTVLSECFRWAEAPADAAGGQVGA